MTREPVLIRVDATASQGYERLARCLILAAALQRRRRPTYFLTQLDHSLLALSIRRYGTDWLAANHAVSDPESIDETKRHIHRLEPAAVIVDDPDATQSYLADLGRTGTTVVSLDHAANIRFPSHMVINPLLGPSKESYEFKPGCQLLLGQRYALVRSEVRRTRPGRSQEPPPICAPGNKAGTGQFRALLALMEDDPHRHTIEMAKLLMNVPRLAKVDIVVRRQHPDLEAIQELAAAHPDRLEVALEPAEIAARITRCHFAVTPGNGWSMELACVGVPQLLIVQSEAHWPTAQRLEEEGCATCLGWHENVSAGTIRQAIQNLLTDPLERQAMARCGRKLIDGRGPDRFVIALELMLNAQQRQLRTFSHAA